MNDELEKLEEKIDDHEERIKALEEGESPREKPKGKPPTLPEFMDGRKIKYHRHKALRAGYYLEFYKERDSFTTEDIKESYKKCGFSLPSNMSDVLKKMYSRGLLREEGEEKGIKLWSLSNTGRKNVEEEDKDE